MIQETDERHNVNIKARKRLEMTGIIDVSSFDDLEIIVQTENSSISIEGEELKIESFNSESTDLLVKGKINGIYYFNKATQKKKSIKNLFK